jgi:hypothetical protein
MVKEKKPHLVFLMETKCHNKNLDFLRIKLRYDNIFVVDSVGRSGGLILLWRREVQVEIENYSRRHIHALVSVGRDGREWKFTGFYGHPETAKRRQSWALLRHLSAMTPSPLMCVGDFNEIVSLSEKWGAVTRANGQMEAFRRALEDCQLFDQGFKGPKYTWSNGCIGGDYTRERLDRVVATSEWRAMFDAMEVQVMANRSSDHHPLFVNFNDTKIFGKRFFKPFRVEASWSVKEDFKDVVKSAWTASAGRGDRWEKINGKLNNCKRSIKRWVRKNVQAAAGTIQSKTKELELLQKENDGLSRKEEKILKEEIDGLLEQEEAKWKQRAKENWLRHGDRNTKYFHACATQRQRRNAIEQVMDGRGNMCTTAETIEKAFVSFYDNLFTSARPNNMENCTDAIRSKVSDVMNCNLMAEFTNEEVKQALYQMAPTKAPGPDGFTMGFYQQHWDTVGPEVCETVLHFFNSSHMNGPLNFTNIVLIPKNNNPASVSEYRPISLCNVLYKIISKVLANRLKLILPSLISPYQSAFLTGRLITDNILVAYETMHSMHTKMWSKVGFMGIKLDMSKAYD